MTALKKWRLMFGESLDDFSLAIGIEKSRVIEIEQGQKMTEEEVEKYEDYYCVPIDELLDFPNRINENFELTLNKLYEEGFISLGETEPERKLKDRNIEILRFIDILLHDKPTLEEIELTNDFITLLIERRLEKNENEE